MNPEKIVQKNLDAYNNQNIEEFMQCFSEGIAIYNFQESTPTIVGLTAVREKYEQLFEKSPQLNSTILKRIIIGNKVIDHESIIGRLGSKEIVELVLIYEVKKDKIYRLTVMTK